MKVGSLKRSSILACQHHILSLTHYREDGSCRCNDPEHTEMRGWGYRWDAKEQRWKGAVK